MKLCIAIKEESIKRTHLMCCKQLTCYTVGYTSNTNDRITSHSRNGSGGNCPLPPAPLLTVATAARSVLPHQLTFLTQPPSPPPPPPHSTSTLLPAPPTTVVFFVSNCKQSSAAIMQVHRSVGTLECLSNEESAKRKPFFFRRC